MVFLILPLLITIQKQMLIPIQILLLLLNTSIQCLPSAGGETIWVRAVNLDGCVTVSSFELIIDTVSDYTEVPLFQVNDDDGTPDGFYEFDLDSQSPIITAGDP